MLLSSIGNGEYLGRGNAGFRDQGEDTGKVVSLEKNDDHVHMRLCAHRFGIEAEVSPGSHEHTNTHARGVRPGCKHRGVCSRLPDIDTPHPPTQAMAWATSMERVYTVMLWLKSKNIHHLPDPRAAAWGITQYNLGTMAQTPPEWIYVPGKHLKPTPPPTPQYPPNWPPRGVFDMHGSLFVGL